MHPASWGYLLPPVESRCCYFCLFLTEHYVTWQLSVVTTAFCLHICPSVTRVYEAGIGEPVRLKVTELEIVRPSVKTIQLLVINL